MVSMRLARTVRFKGASFHVVAHKIAPARRVIRVHQILTSCPVSHFVAGRLSLIGIEVGANANRIRAGIRRHNPVVGQTEAAFAQFARHNVEGALCVGDGVGRVFSRVRIPNDRASNWLRYRADDIIVIASSSSMSEKPAALCCQTWRVHKTDSLFGQQFPKNSVPE